MNPRHLVDVHVLLVRGSDVLLIRRRGGLFDGLWHLPSGKVEVGESVLRAAVREAEEEVGVLVAEADLRHVHTVHVNGSGPEARFGLFFEVRRWIGEPVNREPDKCSALAWFDLDQLPGDVIEYPAAGVRAYRAGVAFGVRGW